MGPKDGQSATTKESKQIEQMVKYSVAKIYDEVKKLGYPIKWTSDLKSTRSSFGGCKPDGGIFFFRDYAIVINEAKHQGNAGNAIERSYKNVFVVQNKYDTQRVVPSYLIFASGVGCSADGPIPKTLSYLVEEGGVARFDHYRPGSVSCYLNPSESIIYHTILEAVKERCEKIMSLNHFSSGLVENEDLPIDSSRYSMLVPKFKTPACPNNFRPLSTMSSPSSGLELFFAG
jgi:hypothetical protein